MNFIQKYTVVFLGDQMPPTKLILLRRGMDRKFAPNLHTGIGGKVEKEEDVMAGALRELQEETNLSISNIALTEFGRVVGNKQWVLHYFFGIISAKASPMSPEGDELLWVPVDDIFSKEIIPSTKLFLKEWKRRLWVLEPFTMFMQWSNEVDINATLQALDIKEGLH